MKQSFKTLSTAFVESTLKISSFPFLLIDSAIFFAQTAGLIYMSGALNAILSQVE